MELVIPATLALAVTLTALIGTTIALDLTPRYFKNEFTSCTTKTNVSGKCVDWSYCNEKYEIEVGGIIAESELRSLECKNKEWCCSEKNVIAPPPPKTQVPDSSSNCIVTEQPDCPWCVKLYRDGKDRRRSSSGFFCMGTLIATRVILTTGTCMTQARFQNLWARIPNSANPNANYTVKFRLKHPEYNSGSRENDLALLTIDPEPDWSNGGRKGACLGLQPNLLVGECIAGGIDVRNGEKLHMTPLLVVPGNCGSGAASDASCGHAIGEACTVIDGAPIMCRPNDGPFMLTGLSKVSCINDPPQSLLSNLVQAEKWINNSLKGVMGLVEKEYLKLST